MKELKHLMLFIAIITALGLFLFFIKNCDIPHLRNAIKIDSYPEDK